MVYQLQPTMIAYLSLSNNRFFIASYYLLSFHRQSQNFPHTRIPTQIIDVEKSPTSNCVIFGMLFHHQHTWVEAQLETLLPNQPYLPTVDLVLFMVFALDGFKVDGSFSILTANDSLLLLVSEIQDDCYFRVVADKWLEQIYQTPQPGTSDGITTGSIGGPKVLDFTTGAIETKKLSGLKMGQISVVELI